MGRRGNQSHPRGGMTGFGNPRVYFAARQMPALPGLCALCHLYLNLLRTDKVTAGYAKAPACHLFDGRAAVYAVFPYRHTLQILAALAGITLTVKPVHGNGKGLMRLLGNRSVGHGSGFEPCDNGIHTLHLCKRHSFFRVLKIHQPPQVFHGSLVIHERRILFK